MCHVEHVEIPRARSDTCRAAYRNLSVQLLNDRCRAVKVWKAARLDLGVVHGIECSEEPMAGIGLETVSVSLEDRVSASHKASVDDGVEKGLGCVCAVVFSSLK